MSPTVQNINITYLFSQWINYVHQSLHKIFTDWWHQIHFNALYFSGGDTPLAFSRILHFGTGSKEPPPLRFYPEPSICYWQEKLAKTITCTNTLLVFIYQLQITTYKDFKNSMEFAVLNNEEFLLLWTFCLLEEPFIMSTP